MSLGCLAAMSKHILVGGNCQTASLVNIRLCCGSVALLFSSTETLKATSNFLRQRLHQAEQQRCNAMSSDTFSVAEIADQSGFLC